MIISIKNSFKNIFEQKYRFLIILFILFFLAPCALYSNDNAETVYYNLIPKKPLTATLTIGLNTYSVTYPDLVSVPVLATSPYITGYIISEATVNGKKITNQVHITINPLTGDDDLTKSWYLESGIKQDNDKLVSHGQIKNRNIYINPPSDKCQMANSKFEILDDSRVFLVDYNIANGNMLFRGNMPLKKGLKNQKFDFQGLNRILKKRFEQQIPDSVFPKKYFLIDVSLICDMINDEGPALYIEYKYFGGKNAIAAIHSNVATDMNPDSYQPPLKDSSKRISNRCNTVSRLLWWPIEPGGWDLAKTGVSYMRGKKLQRAKPIQKLVKSLLKKMENRNEDLPCVIYVHCMNGQDRTSEVAVCYLMKRYKLSLNNAYIYGTTLLTKSGDKVRLDPRKGVFDATTNTMRAYSKYLGQPKKDWNGKIDSTTTLSNYPWESNDSGVVE